GSSVPVNARTTSRGAVGGISAGSGTKVDTDVVAVLVELHDRIFERLQAGQYRLLVPDNDENHLVDIEVSRSQAIDLRLFDPCENLFLHVDVILGQIVAHDLRQQAELLSRRLVTSRVGLADCLLGEQEL